MSDKNGKRSEQESIRDNLENILQGIPEMPEMGMPTDKIQHPDTRTMKFYTVKEEAEDEAEDTVDAMVEFYLDAVLEKKPQAKRKKKADIIALGHLFFMLKTQQHAVIKLMEEIDIGNMNVKLFEALERMQGRLESITKTSAQFRNALEQSYQAMMQDELRKREREGSKTIDVDHEELKVMPGETIKSRGTKEIMSMIRPDEMLGSKDKMEPAGLVDARVTRANPHQEEKKHEEDNAHLTEDMFDPLSGEDK